MKILIFVAFCSLICYSLSQSAKLDEEEVEAVRGIFRNLGFAELGVDEDPCDNSRKMNVSISCNCSFGSNTTCRVISLIITGYVSAPLPVLFAKLQHLKQVDITYNYVTGTIPSEWATMRLTTLALSANLLSGPFPIALTRMTSLTNLDIEGNRFSGPIPEEIGNLKHLSYLFLSSNEFTGRLPVGLAKLTNLTEMKISDNYFTGRIPSFISRWTQIRILHIQGCSFKGPIPSNISVLTQLCDLRISDLRDESSTFPSLEKMLDLETLVLRNCLLRGKIPDYFVEMTYLRILDLSFNNLTGEIPLCNSLRYIFLTNNTLTGTMPPWIFSSTKNLDISYNNFTWNVSAPKKCPKETLNIISSYSTSTNTDINPCLRKDFPCTKSIAQQIYSLHINCGGEELYINNTIKFDDNTEGKGPSRYYENENWAFSNTGKFLDYVEDYDPYIISNQTNLNSISTHDIELYKTARASAISLTYYGLCLMNGNYSVNLHFAEIVFTQDKNNSSNILGKRVFDVYVQGVLRVKDFDIVKEAGGIGRAVIKSYTVIVKNNTLKIQLFWAGKGTTIIPIKGCYGPIISAISVYPNFKPPKFGKKFNFVGVVVGPVVGLLLILFLVYVYRKCYIVREKTEARGTHLSTGIFTKEMIQTATNNFDKSNKLGEGGFGIVYKGEMPDGTKIAAKRLSPTSTQGPTQLLKEIGVISTLKHKNFVTLYGVCVEDNNNCLVYELVTNNSLSQALLENKSLKARLTWPVRLNICKGIAQGLEYLHQHKVVHRDIKPSNVLLDEHFHPKISDFGLAILYDDAKTREDYIAGTAWYMDPEYAKHGQLNDKVDVYSFGVVILEVVCGQKICKSKTNPSDNLIAEATMLNEKGNLLQMVDPDLRKRYSQTQATKLLNLAILCTKPAQRLRPTMSEVIEVFDGKKHYGSLVKNEADYPDGPNMRHYWEVDWTECSSDRVQVNDDTFTESFVTDTVITQSSKHL